MNRRIRLIVLLWFTIFNSLGSQTYSESDSLALLAVDSVCDGSGTLNWDTEPDPGNWTGITWDTLVPRRVIELKVGVKDLSGILNATSLSSLRILHCFYNDLSGLKVNGLDSLLEISCNINQLDSLDVSNLDNLRFLFCSQNDLTFMDVSNCTLLDQIDCAYNDLESLEMPELIKFRFLYCSFNSLKTLDVTKLPKLVDLWCDYNQLTSLDLSGQTTLFQLDFSNNYLSVLDLSDLEITGSLRCINNNLSYLDVSGSEDIYDVRCENNRLPFSSLITAYGVNYFTYSPQKRIFLPAEREVDTTLNYSSEANIEDTLTQFVFYKDDVPAETNNSGVFATTGVGIYHCLMTNALFPGLTLTTASVTVTGVSGIVPVSKEELCVYPNPVTDIFHLSPSQQDPISGIRMYAAEGREILFDENPASPVEIDMVNFSPGLYIVKIITPGSTASVKLIKQ